MLSRALGHLAAGSAEAAETLRALLGASCPPQVRLGASRALLELGARLRESAEFGERLSALEDKVRGRRR